MIKSLSEVSKQDIYRSFAEAFADYEIQLNERQLLDMLHRRGWDPELSFGAFQEGRLVSFTLNGIGIYNGIKTAYDTGTGTAEAFRGKGLASAIFEHSLPFLKDAGIVQYLLEVLQHNPKAVNLYRKLGFEVSREFNYFSEGVEKLNLQVKFPPEGIKIRPASLEQIEALSDCRDFAPSWQNSFSAITRNPGDFKMFGAYLDSKLAGYCVFEPVSGDITLLAVDRQHRRLGIGKALLAHALEFNQNDTVKCINTDIHCESITGFLQSAGITLKGRQFEMIKQL